MVMKGVWVTKICNYDISIKIASRGELMERRGLIEIRGPNRYAPFSSNFFWDHTRRKSKKILGIYTILA